MSKLGKFNFTIGANGKITSITFPKSEVSVELKYDEAGKASVVSDNVEVANMVNNK